MKWLFIVLITVLVAFFLCPAQPDSQLYAVRSQIADRFKPGPSAGKSEQEKQELLAAKREELKAYEDTLQQVEADIVKMSNVGTCNITGQPNQFKLDKDPRPELQAKIDKVKEEIRQLESKS
jgi:hypothetical protein